MPHIIAFSFLMRLYYIHSFLRQFSKGGSLTKHDFYLLLNLMDNDFDRRIKKIEFLDFFGSVWASRLLKLQVSVDHYINIVMYSLTLCA